MPIKSYLAYPAEGRRQELIQALQEIPECEIIPAENRDVIVLVTDTANVAAEKILEAKLESIPELQALAMVSGYDDLSKDHEA